MSHTKGLAEVKELPCSKGGTMKFMIVDGTGIAVMCGKVGGAKVEEANARRLAALWNAAEELGLTTEQVKDGIIQMEFAHNHERSGVIEYMVARLQDCMSEKKEAQRAAGRLKDQYENVSKHYSRRGEDIERLKAEKAEMLEALENLYNRHGELSVCDYEKINAIIEKERASDGLSAESRI